MKSIFSTLALLLLLTSPSIPSVRAQSAPYGADTNAPALSPAPLVIEATRSILGDIDNGLRVLMADGTNTFGLQVPAGFTLRSEPGRGMLIIEPGNRSGSIVISYLKSSAPTRQVISHDLLRPLILAAHPGANILGESTSTAMDADALSFDLDTSNGNAQGFCQIIAAPTPDGCIEITAYATNESKGEILTWATRIRSSLRRAGPDGRVKFHEPVGVF